MRGLWLVTALAATSCCKLAQHGNDFTRGPFGGSECTLIGKGEKPEMESKALDFFLLDVQAEAKISKYRVLQVTSCPKDFFVPIEATTEAIDTPREWFVQVPKDGGPMSLIRPE